MNLQSQNNSAVGHAGVQVHPLSRYPEEAYIALNCSSLIQKEEPLPLTTPMQDDKVRFVCVSDTHNMTKQMGTIPNGDVLIHAGDFTQTGTIEQILHFKDWIESLPHKQKVFIAGNHEISYDASLLRSSDPGMLKRRWGVDTQELEEYLQTNNLEAVKDIMLKDTSNLIYLEDEAAWIHGLKIWGSPWQPKFGGWGFNLPRGAQCLEKWNVIPADVDVLITHGPPLGAGDLTSTKQRAGCVELYNSVVNRIKPKYHIFGHIHEDPGQFRHTGGDSIRFINASNCNLRYVANQPPIIFDLAMPKVVKTSV